MMDSISNINQSYMNTNEIANSQSADPTTMDEDSFMQLLIASLQNQNPLEPMQQGEMMAQLTQLTMVENVTKMTSAVDQLLEKEADVNPLANYLGLTGKNVRVQENGEFFEGRVISVGRQNENIVFELENGEAYLVKDIVGVSEMDTSVPEVDEEDTEEVDTEEQED